MLATNFARAKVPIKYGLTRSCTNVVLVPIRELHFGALTRRGVYRAPPSSVKIRIIRSLLKLRRPGTSFIETGTYLADTVAWSAGWGMEWSPLSLTRSPTPGREAVSPVIPVSYLTMPPALTAGTRGRTRCKFHMPFEKSIPRTASTFRATS
jgi:hypothetical protein